MTKKANYKSGFIFLLAAFLCVFVTASFVANTESNKLTGNAIQHETITIKKSNAIMLPDAVQPYPNGPEGTISIWTKPPIEVFKQFDGERKYIIFFSSSSAPGLRIVYNTEDQVFEAGTPIMKSKKVNIFDNTPHNIVYTFKENNNQNMFLDGQATNTSKYQKIVASDITGMIIGTNGNYDKSDIKGVEIATYDKYVEFDELDLIQ